MLLRLLGFTLNVLGLSLLEGIRSVALNQTQQYIDFCKVQFLICETHLH